MHEWAAVNGWTRPEIKSDYGRYSVNIPIITTLPKSGYARYSKTSYTPLSPKSEITRCHTTLLGQATFMEKQQVYKHREEHGQSSTTQFIRYLKVVNKDSHNRIKNPVHLLNLERCRTDVGAGMGKRDLTFALNNHGITGTGYGRAASDVEKHSPTTTPYSSCFDRVRHENTLIGFGNMVPNNKQEMKLTVAKLPKKGLVSLSTNEQSHPQERQFHPAQSQVVGNESHKPHSSLKRQKTSTIIKRTDILNHLKVGSKLLHDVEEQKRQEEALIQSLADYTIVDLKSQILEMTDTKSLRNRSGTEPVYTSSKPSSSKGHHVTLPTINSIKPFSTRS